MHVSRRSLNTQFQHIPQLLQRIQGVVNLLLLTTFDHSLYFHRMRAIHDLEYIIAAYKAEASRSTLQVVDGLSHVPFCTKDKRSNTIVTVLNILCFADLIKPLHNLSICQPRVSQYGTSRLQRLNDLVALIAGERKPCRARIYLHRSPQRLLCPGCHAVCLIQNNDLLPARWKCDFLLREALDPISHNIDATFITRVQLQHGFFICISQ